ncbi:MAG: hypothetical protein ACYDD1_11295 [Caulobacteraceae bacterium]
MALSIPLIGVLAAAALTLGMCHHAPKAAQKAQAAAVTATSNLGLTKAVTTLDQTRSEKDVHLFITTQAAHQAVEVSGPDDNPGVFLDSLRSVQDGADAGPEHGADPAGSNRASG